MSPVDRDKLLTMYIRCYMDQISLLERLYLADGVRTAQEIEKLEEGISRFHTVMRKINLHITNHGGDPIASIYVKNWMGNC